MFSSPTTQLQLGAFRPPRESYLYTPLPPPFELRAFCPCLTPGASKRCGPRQRRLSSVEGDGEDDAGDDGGGDPDPDPDQPRRVARTAGRRKTKSNQIELLEDAALRSLFRLPHPDRIGAGRGGANTRAVESRKWT
jgi:hypothetical protein